MAPRARAFLAKVSASSSRREAAPPLIPAIWPRTVSKSSPFHALARETR